MIRDTLSKLDLERRLVNLLRWGRITETIEAQARCRVRVGELETVPLPWLTLRAGPDATWWAPEEDEQVLVLSPSGDLAQGVILPAVYQSQHPAPANLTHVHRHKYADGAVLEYDRNQHRLTAQLPPGATLVVNADGGLSVTGDIAVTGTVTVSGDVVASGVSLVSHIHGQVEPGGGSSGPPL